MPKEKINLAEAADLTKNLFHSHYAGNLEHWFSYLCSDSIYLGTGEPLLLGGDVIKEHFKGFEGRQVDILQEEYYPIALGDTAVQVCGQIIVQNKDRLFRVINCFTIGFRIIGGELKLVHLHNSYEYMSLTGSDKNNVLNLDVNTMQFVRSLLLGTKTGKRISVRSGNQTVFVNPNLILYVQSQKKKTEIVCIDRVISCNSALNQLQSQLPDSFYPIHRGYLVNPAYIVAIRRFEAELISGISIPIPALTYTQIKDDLQNMIQSNLNPQIQKQT